MSDPTTPIQIELHRDRVLSEIPVGQQPDAEMASEASVRALFRKASVVSNKSNVLRIAIEKTASKYFIPVPADAEEVRAAVLRKSSETKDGSIITFDLFRSAVEAALRRKQMVTDVMIRSAGEVPSEALRKTIRVAQMRAACPEDSSGLSADDLVLMASHIFILFLANKLIGTFQGTDNSEIVAAIPDGEPAQGVVATQILIAIGFQLLLFGINEDLLAEMLEKSNALPPGISGRSIVNQAKQQEFGPLHKMAIGYVGLDDFDKILRYCSEYISTHPEPGLEMWVGYLDCVLIRQDCFNLWAQKPRYLPTEAHQEPRGRKALSPNDSGGTESNWSFREIVESSIVGMSTVRLSEEDRSLNSSSKSLNLIAQTLSLAFSPESICCLARFLIHIPREKLELLRAILNALLRTNTELFFLDLQRLIGSLIGVTASEALVRELLYSLESFLQESVERVLGLFGEETKLLLCCQLIKDLIESVLRLLVTVVDKLSETLELFGKSITLKASSVEKRYLYICDQRYVSQLLKVMDRVLSALEATQICSETPIDDLILQRVASQVRDSSSLDRIRISEEDAEKYFSDADVKEGNYKRIIPAIGREVSLDANLGDLVTARSDAVADSLSEVGDVLKNAPSQVLRDTSAGISGILGNLGIVDPQGSPKPVSQESERAPGLSLCYKLFTELQAKNAASGI